MSRLRLLTIAGSDSSGGAGIQADLKTFASLGAYGMSVITALTAQNTLGVAGVYPVDPRFVAAQLDAVCSDVGVDAAKTGMLFSADVIRAVAAGVRRWRLSRLVVDPVMVATSGDRLLEEDAVAAMVADLLPLAAVVTPNLPEAEVLADHPIADREDLERAARAIAGHGAATVLIKGGHRAVPGASGDGEANDWLWDGTSLITIEGPRIATTSTHGTGCTLSAAIAVRLAAGDDPRSACIAAKEYLAGALSHAEPLGSGRGPVDHLWRAGAPVR
ncbi:MAG: bifunctional hydroxymethylpyrimidine kinase/phosphomethylpyrimidine kinase [Chloroflexota bacterium]|nr:bifunctional hydroxymethylpyrimidine kinase/phosphomethylpyrimidine kinase [Chloroflexota bacterium]